MQRDPEARHPTTLKRRRACFDSPLCRSLRFARKGQPAPRYLDAIALTDYYTL